SGPRTNRNQEANMETKLDKKNWTGRARRLFALGAVVVSDGAAHALDPGDIVLGLTRHARGDWGEVSTEDWEANDLSLAKGARRLLSEYTAKNLSLFWVIAEADRSATTVLMPEEYQP